MKRKIVRVRRRKGWWGVYLDGARRPLWWVWEKTFAVAIAKGMLNAFPGTAQLVVHGRDGRIQTEWTYGKDPRRSRG